MARNKRQWYIFLADIDQKAYDVIGPFSDDDTPWIDAIDAGQKNGRDLQWQYLDGTDFAAIDGHAAGSGLSRAPQDSLLVVSMAGLADFKGALPKYAADADRSRIVRFFCKGKCNGKTSWGELDVTRPDSTTLRSAPMGVYRATCLRCGFVASDNYNWSL